MKQPKCERCGKNRYRSAGIAAAVAAHQTRKHGSLRIYQCPYGNGFHLTSLTAVGVKP